MSSYTLSYSSKLTEDFIHSESILASSSALAPLATFVNPSGQTEALVIHDDGELCHLQREPLSNSGWNIFGIGAQVNLIAAANSGSVWITDNNNAIWQSNAGHWNPLGNVNGGLYGISVGRDSTVYAVAEQGNDFHLFIYDSGSGSFQDTGVVNIHEAPKGSVGALWSLVNDTVMMSTTPGQWNPAPGSFESGDVPTYISVGTDGSVFVLCSGSEAIYSYDASSQSWAQDDASTRGCNRFRGAECPDAVRAAKRLDGDSVLLRWLMVNHCRTSIRNQWYFDGQRRVAVVSGFKRNRVAQRCRKLDSADDTDGAARLYLRGYRDRSRHRASLRWNQYAFYVENGDLHVSMLDRSRSWDGIWTAGSSIVSGCSNLRMTIAPGANATWNDLVVYGVSSVGTFLLVTCNNGAWTPAEVTVGTEDTTLSLVGATVQYAAVNREIWWLWVVVGNELYGQTSLNFTEPPTILTGYPLPTSASAQTIIPFSAVSHSSAGLYTAVLDTTGQVWFAALDLERSYTPQFTQLSGAAIESPIGTVQSAVALCSGQPSQYTTNARIFARDANNTLWIIRLTVDAQTPAAPYTWSEWHPLGNDCVFLANGPANVPSTDLFMLDEGYEVNVLSEDVTTGVWRDLVMLKPAGTNTDAEYVTRYLTEVTITDENSIPQTNFSVGVTADEPVGIWVATTLYDVTTSTPIQLTTNAMGKVTFAFFATDIDTPTFSFTADGLTNPPSIYPAQQVNDYLAGKAGSFPGRPDFDSAGTTLLGAQMQTEPEWSEGSTTLLVQSQDQANAPAAAQGITQIYTMPTTGTGSSGQWQVASSQVAGVGSSHFWNDVCQYSHDIDHAIRKAAMKVNTIAVDVENKLISFTMELANGLSQVLQLAINTVQDVISAVKSVFRYVERAVDDVIDWLKSLFEWGDILNTKMVIETCLNGLMTKLGENFDPTSPVYAGTLFTTYFNKLASTVQQAFNDAEHVFSATQTFSNTSSSVSYPDSAKPLGNDALHPTNMSNAQSANSTHSNYVHTHILNYTAQGGSFPPTAMGDGTSGDGILQTLFDTIDQNLNQGPFKTAHMETMTSLQSIFSDPKNFADVVMYDVINAIQKAVMCLLDVIESVVEVLLSLAGNALAGFQALLNKTIDIPVISWIYLKISDHPLTMLDLFCLTMAVPVTLIYKLTFGLPNATPPFTDEGAQTLIDEFSNPASFPWPAIASNGASPAAAPKLLGSFPFGGAAILMPFIFGTYAICDVFTDLAAYGEMQKPPVAGEPPDPAATFLS
jgi:hypothetical protein